MAKRRYSDEERAACLAALAANAGDVSKTAQQVGVPRETLRCWANGTRHPEVMQTHQEKKPQLADRLEELAHRLADAALEPERLVTTPLQQVVTSLAIAVDKMRLLRSQSTVDVTSGGEPLGRDSLTAADLAAAAQLLGMAGLRVPAHGGPQSVDQPNSVAEAAAIPPLG